MIPRGIIDIECLPLTPVWTGDASDDSSRRGYHIRETGLRGSIRNWYETLLRGAGLTACDPSGQSCIYDPQRGLSSICHACQTFGCTGYSSRVRLEIDGAAGPGVLKELRLRNPGKQGHRGWRVPASLNPKFRLKIVPLHAGVDIEGLLLTLRLIEKYGALGAKTSHGQGAVRFQNLPPANARHWQSQMVQCPAKSGIRSPNLAEMIGVWFRLSSLPTQLPLSGDLPDFNISTQSAWVPTAPLIRASLRDTLRSAPVNDRHRIMGTIHGWGDPKRQTKGSDVHVTHAYRTGGAWETRIFAFVPQSNNAGDRTIRTVLSELAPLSQRLSQALGLSADITVRAEAYPDSISRFLDSLEDGSGAL